MTKKITLALIPIFLMIVLIDSFNNELISNSTGSPGGRSGSPGDGNQTCKGCHTDAMDLTSSLPANSESFFISTNIPAGGYISGQTYQITIGDGISALSGVLALAGIGEFGFEMSAEDGSNNKVGTFTAGSGSKLVGQNITHSVSQLGTAPSWVFDWTAPSVGTGAVTFYGAYNGANNNGTAMGDNLITVNIQVNEDPFNGINEEESVSSEVFPNPAAEELNVKIHTQSASAVSIELFDLQGKMVSQLANFNVESGLSNGSYDVSNIDTGIYLLKVQTENASSIQKVIIQ